MNLQRVIFPVLEQIPPTPNPVQPPAPPALPTLQPPALPSSSQSAPRMTPLPEQRPPVTDLARMLTHVRSGLRSSRRPIPPVGQELTPHPSPCVIPMTSTGSRPTTSVVTVQNAATPERAPVSVQSPIHDPVGYCNRLR